MRKILLTMMALIAGTTLSFADDSYELVTSESSLAAGDEVLIVYYSSGSYYAMGAQSGNYRSGVKVTVSSSAISLSSTSTDVTRFTLDKNSNYWIFYSESDKGYLGLSSSYLTTTTSISTANNVTLSFSDSSGATSFRIGSSSRYLTYTTNNSRFSTTTSTTNSTNIRIFKLKVVANPPTFTPSGGNYDAEQNVMLSTTTTGASIYYTTDGSTPTTSSTQYANAITVGEGTTTIKAIAVNRGVSSEVAEATYVIKLPEKETFHLVTNAATLTAGDTILVVYGTNNKAMADQISEGNRASTKVSIADNTIVMLKENNAASRFILGGSASARTFLAINNTEGYLYNSGTEGYLMTQTTAGDYSKASITIDTNGNATIKFAAEGSNNLLAYYSAGPGGDDPTPPIVGAPRKAPVAGSEVDCFTFIDEINEDEDYYPIQLYTKNPHEVVTTDINQDGQWNIADVTMLVNYLLGQNPEGCNVDACDVDGSGTIDTDDIPALINIILTQE